MFSPKDSGLQLPLQGKLYHGRRVICDAVGNELFILELIRPSIEAKQMLDEWMEAICEKFNVANSGIISKEVYEKIGSAIFSNQVEVPEQIGVEVKVPIKRKRGRPRKVYAKDRIGRS